MRRLNTNYKFSSELTNMSKAPAYNFQKKIVKEAPSRIFRVEEDLQRWRAALNAVENVTYPTYAFLTQVYNEVELDSSITCNKEIRKNYVSSREFTVTKNGKEDKKAIEFFNGSWFPKFVNEVLESIFWGYKLIQINGIENDQITDIEAIRQQNVNPKTNRLLEMPYNIHSGIDYLEDEEFSPWLLFCSNTDYNHHYYGLMNKLAPHALYKKLAENSLADYVMRFGSPNVVYKSHTKSEEKYREIEYFLSNFNNLSYGIFDKDDEIQVVESSGKSSEVFLSAIKQAEDAIAKLILGSNISSEQSFVGSASVHEQIATDYSFTDIKYVEGVINNQLIPKMINLGLTFLKDVKVSYITQPKIDENSLFNQVILLLQNGYEVEDKYILETFGIPVKKKIIEMFQEPKTDLETDV